MQQATIVEINNVFSCSSYQAGKKIERTQMSYVYSNLQYFVYKYKFGSNNQSAN